MVKETGEATERFLRAVAFGNTETMVEMLEEKAKNAQQELENVADPEAAVKDLACMAHAATNKINRLLSTMSEATEIRSSMEALHSGDEVSGFCSGEGEGRCLPPPWARAGIAWAALGKRRPGGCGAVPLPQNTGGAAV